MHIDITEQTRKISTKVAPLAIAVAISAAIVLCLPGCDSQTAAIDPENQTLTASEYMVKLNQAADSMHENLAVFAAAVNSGDISTLQAKADAAFQEMDALNDLKTPDEIADVRNQYKEATDALHNALNEYIAIYLDIQNEPEQSKIDSNKYAERFETVQKDYDNGINLLEKADAAAKEL